MKRERIHGKLSTYRFEFLLAALTLLIFDKIFFPSNDFFIRYVWPINMIIIALASFGIFVERELWVKRLRIVFSNIAILMPFGFLYFSPNFWFVSFLVAFYIVFYIFILVEVFRQITMAKEVRFNVVIGSFCGYLLLSMVALFSYLAIELNYPESFRNISKGNFPAIYNELSYFSFITLTSIGFGDIYPTTDMSRLTVAFFGMLGQFYMVAVIGIIISRFTSNH
ncbi:MAG TPA: potassium channel family protein [Saprospiraceae bacterium]|nr:potassium channel family protein [Saprospiraceae bacterium]